MKVILLKPSADDLQEDEEMEEMELEEGEEGEEGEEIEEESTLLNATPKASESQSKKSRYPWRPHFLTKYPWLEYDSQTETASCSQSNCTMCHYHLSDEANDSTWTHRFENRLFRTHQNSKGHFTKHLPIPERGQQLLSLP